MSRAWWPWSGTDRQRWLGIAAALAVAGCTLVTTLTNLDSPHTALGSMLGAAATGGLLLIRWHLLSTAVVALTALMLFLLDWRSSATVAFAAALYFVSVSRSR
ncbi:MAG TPA: hypothetical protein VI076_10545, partial [Actinopolymorphaceae bacterium]